MLYLILNDRSHRRHPQVSSPSDRRMYRNKPSDNIVTDLINALSGNSSVNVVQTATIEEGVFCRSERRASRLAE
jgi:hypothetical protein